MKRILTASLFLFIQSVIVWGQNQMLPYYAAQRQHYDISHVNAFNWRHSQNTGQRAQENFVLDYVSAEQNYASLNGSYFYFLFWPINNAFKSGPPMDTTGNFTCKWAAVQFDTLYDYVTEEGYPYPGTEITIDSIALYMNHRNNSGQNDTLILSVLARAANPLGFTTSNNYVSLTNTVLWDTSVITNQSLTAGVPSNQARLVVFPCGYRLPTGQRFIVKVDFKGPLQDTLDLADFNRDDCRSGPPPQGEFVNASLSVFPFNSWRYLNLFFPPSTNLTGIDPLVLQNADTLCDLFYFQNWGILTLVTLNVPLSLTGSQSETNICPGEVVSLSVTPQGGTPPYNIVWSPTTGLNPPFGSFTPQATVTANTTYTATVTDADNTTQSISFPINVRTITVDAGADQTIACGGTANLTATPGGEFVPSTYTWSTGANTLDISVTAAGTYSITATNSYGCTATDAVVVTLQGVNQNLSFTTSASNNISCVGQNISFTNTSSDLGPQWSWLWDFGDGVQNTQQSPTYAYSQPGNYTVSLSATAVISGQTCPVGPVTKNLTINQTCPTGIENVLLDKVLIYPNPSEGIFTVSFSGLGNREGVIGIYDIRGALIAEQNIAVDGNSQKVFDFGKAADGIYFVKIQLENDMLVRKLALNGK